MNRCLRILWAPLILRVARLSSAEEEKWIADLTVNESLVCPLAKDQSTLMSITFAFSYSIANQDLSVLK